MRLPIKPQPQTPLFSEFLLNILYFSLINIIAHLQFQSHLILLSTKCYECRKSKGLEGLPREREKKEKQTNREKRGIIKVRSDKRLGTERVKGKETSTSGGKECQHTSGYDAIFFFFTSKQSIMQNKSKAGQNSHGYFSTPELWE